MPIQLAKILFGSPWGCLLGMQPHPTQGSKGSGEGKVSRRNCTVKRNLIFKGWTSSLFRRLGSTGTNQETWNWRYSDSHEARTTHRGPDASDYQQNDAKSL